MKLTKVTYSPRVKHLSDYLSIESNRPFVSRPLSRYHKQQNGHQAVQDRLIPLLINRGDAV